MACKVRGEGFFIGQDAGLRTHGSGEAGEDFCVDSVGLGEASGGLGVVASLAGVDHGYGDSGCRDGSSSGALVAPAGPQDDQLGGRLFEPLDEGVDSLLVVGECESLALGHQADLEAFLGDVYPDVAGSLGVSRAHGAAPSSSYVPGLADMGSSAALAAPATVRAPPIEDGRDDSCFLAVSLEDQGGTGLSRPLRP